MKVTAIYFSATETTKKNVLSIAGALGDAVNEIDVTLPKQYGGQFGPDDLVVFGAPVYGGTLPELAYDRFDAFKGDNTPCILVSTYGNRHYDNALFNMSALVKENGFIPFAGAAVIGQHTFGKIAVGRPNGDDLALNAQFAAKATEKLSAGNLSPISFPGEAVEKSKGRGGRFRPQTTDACVDCGICTAQCPAGAIASDNRTIDDNKCISCFRCIRVCPVGAKVMDTPEYNEFAVGFSQKLAEPRQNEYFL